MSAHTPGPWGYDLPDNWIYAFRENGTQIFVAQARNISVQSEVRDANARLIAAAPELLAALIDALEFLENDCPLDLPCGPEIRQARAAIAKATGAA